MKKKELYIVVAVTVLVGLLIFFGLQKSAEAPAREGDASEYSIVVADQNVRSSAIVESVALTEPGFVIFHKSERGFPTDVLGVSEFLTPGTYSDVNVSMLVDVASGDEIFVLIHADNGDQIFEPANDISVLNEEGSLVMEAFNVL